MTRKKNAGRTTKAKLETWADEEPPEELRRLKSEISKLNKRLLRSRTGEALIIDAVQQAFDDPVALKLPPKPKAQRRKREEQIAVLHVSDTQIGKVTETYNPEIARDRIRLLARKVERIVTTRRAGVNIKECRLHLGGDMVEGENIFPGQAHEIDQPVFDQAVRTVPEILSELIISLTGVFEKVKVLCVVGNHGRIGRKGDGGSKRTNWDRVTYETLKLMMKDAKGRVEFEIGETFYVVDRVFDWGVLSVHGDQIRGSLGFPWYGAGKKAWGWIDSIKEPWDVLIFGHFHTPAFFRLNDRLVYANGTTESSNVYAQEQLAASGDPSQRLMFMNAEHGPISDHLVYLTDRVSFRRRAEEWL